MVLKNVFENHLYFMKANSEKIQKVTVHIPQHLLKAALATTHKNITETVKSGLQELARKQAYENLHKSRGKIKFSIDFNKLREDD